MCWLASGVGRLIAQSNALVHQVLGGTAYLEAELSLPRQGKASKADRQKRRSNEIDSKSKKEKNLA
jgi:hypothetical protein